MTNGGGIPLGGHRGAGCTDHDTYAFRDLNALPVENTLESNRLAFDLGADFIETDAVRAADGDIFSIHNVVPTDHFFAATKPPKFLNLMTVPEIRAFKTGRLQKGEVLTLAETLADVMQRPLKQTPWIVNIELKGVIGSGQANDTEALVDAVIAVVNSSGLQPERILFSSFAIGNVIAMANKMPTAHYGMLFAEDGETARLYASGSDDRYLEFNPDEIRNVFTRWSSDVGNRARLSYLHPEIKSITPSTLGVAKDMNVGIISWALFEKPTEERMKLYRQVRQECRALGIPYIAITDYLPEMKAALA